MEFKSDKEYPSLDGITEDYKTLRVISPAYAGGRGELTAILQYVYQSILLGRLGKKEISKTILHIAINEMRHLELLGTAITMLGAPPAFTACLPYPIGYYSASNVNYAKSPCEMLEADILAESNAIADYRKILTCISNKTLIALIERIIEDEEAHLAAFKSIKEELSRCE
ncbi:MAG: manganese catalase family protein [Clostridia bacterium]|nr:manganese catalase family protein [Clostridia bacterium]